MLAKNICKQSIGQGAIDWSEVLTTNRLVDEQAIGAQTSQKVRNVKHKYNTHQINHNTIIAHYNIIHKWGTVQSGTYGYYIIHHSIEISTRNLE